LQTTLLPKRRKERKEGKREPFSSSLFHTEEAQVKKGRGGRKERGGLYEDVLLSVSGLPHSKEKKEKRGKELLSQFRLCEEEKS